jgi:trehalose-6-phosphate synthase
MKKLFILFLITILPCFVYAQTCSQESCDKKSCGPEGTKVKEAAVITSMRTDLQTVIEKMSKSTVSFDKHVAEMNIEKGTTDDESLLFLSQAISTIRFEFLNKLKSSELVTSLREYKPVTFSTKQQMVAALKKEIKILANQAENL